MRTAVISVLVGLAVLGTSCGNGGNDEDPATATDGAAEEAADAEVVVEVDPAEDEPAAEVEMAGFSFEPETIEIAVGDTVRWTNGDATEHTVTAGVDAEPTGAFHVTFDGRGASAALQFTAPGQYPYFCTPHPFMQGTVNVTR